jgi:hypothetical protein
MIFFRRLAVAEPVSTCKSGARIFLHATSFPKRTLRIHSMLRGYSAIRFHQKIAFGLGETDTA